MKEFQLLKAFENPEEFKRLVKNNSDLCNTARCFPKHAERLIDIVLKNPEEFKRLVKNNIDLRNTATCFPKHAERLIDIVLKNPDEFKRLVKKNGDLHNTAACFPKHAERLIDIVLKNPDEFKRLVKKNGDLHNTAACFPKHAERLIHIVLKNREEFKRLIKNKRDLHNTAICFPKHADIFGKPSVNEAANAAAIYIYRSYAEIRKNACALAQARRTNIGPSFPIVLQEIIASLTGNPAVHDKKEAGDIASRAVKDYNPAILFQAPQHNNKAQRSNPIVAPRPGKKRKL